jgi:signal transduction histidine kinase
MAGVFGNEKLPSGAWFVACFPAFISMLVLGFNHFRKYETALLSYFILQPFFTCIVYLNGLNLGLELYFILYGILSVFFLRDLGYMVFSIAFSMISYFVLTVFCTNYQYQLANSNWTVYVTNQVLAILFIFYGLYLIKKENSGYQSSILEKSEDLLEKNEEIQAQKDIIEEKATLLAAQKEELVELNSLKNKLFSVIAHDLKSPMYALRNLFHNVQQHNVPEQDVREIVPLVVNDLNYTIGLMENLLQWAKTQMSADTVNTQKVDVSGLIQEVMKLLRLQADAKQIYVEQKIDLPVFVSADKDMINLVLRNLLSNAIKFTAPRGQISLGINEHSSFVEIYVQDSGTGITSEELEKIKSNNYYSTNGTASESGTGLGLMLCKDFLARHGGQMYIESQPGKGSTFSFTLPRQA